MAAHAGNRTDRLIARAPAALLDYPFECLLAAWGLISAPPVLIGAAIPSSLAALLPRGMVLAWAGLLLIAAATIGLGIIAGRYSTTVARGLSLLGSVCILYAVAIGSVAGWAQGLPAGALLAVIGWLCYLRAFRLRAQGRMLATASRIAAEVEEVSVRRECD